MIVSPSYASTFAEISSTAWTFQFSHSDTDTYPINKSQYLDGSRWQFRWFGSFSTFQTLYEASIGKKRVEGILNKRSERRRLAFWVLVNGHLLLCTKPKKDKRDRKVKATRDMLEVLRKHDYVHEKRSSKVRKRTDK